MAQEVILPKMGESVAEATIIKWLKSEGDTIEEEESLVEIATDKVDSEIPSPASGIIQKILVKDGEVVNVGAVIALISQNEEQSSPVEIATTSEELKETPPTQEIRSESQIQTTQTTTTASGKIKKIGNSGRFYSPLVRNIALDNGVSMQELEQIPGTGKDGRASKKDILAFLETRTTEVSQPVAEASIEAIKEQEPTPTVPSIEQPKVSSTPTYGNDVEVIPMDRMRKLIAGHMVMSKKTSPHVTAFVETDVTNIYQWRNKVKEQFLKKEGEKITFTPIFIEAVVKAIKDFPLINSSVDGTTIIRKKDINIGMAAALPSGNLIVPVIKHADRMTLAGLTKTVNDLANRARQNKLSPEEIQDGTFTLTNVGTFGNVMGTPIINQPQVAILASGSIQKKPTVVETDKGETIGIRYMMYLSLSFDHRIVDGSLGGNFIRKVADYLEEFDVNREI
ncbi:2-oxo acid dehydrogenase subunit E2 [Cytophagaceae bacterium AH-315-L13]|nr:2-oxo acid dehydrogenase subunit E2 [Cytophagaceae bacterium AH-315-L13]